MVGTGQHQPSLVITRAKGCELWDYEGKTLGFPAVSWSTSISAIQHPRVLAAMKAQLEELVTIAPATANLARGEACETYRRTGAGRLQQSVLYPMPEPTPTRMLSAMAATLYRRDKGAVGYVHTTAIPAARLPPPATGAGCRTSTRAATFLFQPPTSIAANLMP